MSQDRGNVNLMGRMTAAQQRKMVGEGLAIGCVSLGDTEVPADKFAVEAAFRYAWPRWRSARMFPQVRADLSRNDVLLHVIYPSEQRRGIRIAAWRTGRVLHPYLMSEDMSPAEAAEMLSDDVGLDLEAWRELAGGFLGRVHAYGRPASSASKALARHCMRTPAESHRVELRDGRETADRSSAT